MTPDPVDHRPLVDRAVTWLRAQDLAAGDRVATLLGNDLETFALGMACLLEGIIQVPLPPDLPAAERERVLGLAAPAVVVAQAPELDGLDLTAPAAGVPLTRPMTFTSGTSGTRKGVHVGVHDEQWGRAVLADEFEAFDRRHGERHLVVSPLYHSGPFRFAMVTALTGGTVAVMEHFDVTTWQQMLTEYRPTSLFCVPTHLHRLVNHPETTADHFASLTLLAHAGAPCPASLKEQVLELAPDGAVWEFYGSTEGQFTVCPPDLWQRLPGTVGSARTGHRLELRDVGPDGVGTVWCHAPEHARWEYWQDPNSTAAAWDGNTFTVGDMGRLTEADGEELLTLHGRRGDLVISGGVNVYPAEVERVLLTHPGIGEAAVYGIDDAEWGQRVVAAVIPTTRAMLRPADLDRFARAHLRRAEVPKHVHVVDDLPRTPTGKVARACLPELEEP